MTCESYEKRDSKYFRCCIGDCFVDEFCFCRFFSDVLNKVTGNVILGGNDWCNGADLNKDGEEDIWAEDGTGDA